MATFAEEFVKAMTRASNRKPRLTQPQIIPTNECPLPDHTKDISNNEWLVLCHLVHGLQKEEQQEVLTEAR